MRYSDEQSVLQLSAMLLSKIHIIVACILKMLSATIKYVHGHLQIIPSVVVMLLRINLAVYKPVSMPTVLSLEIPRIILHGKY